MTVETASNKSRSILVIHTNIVIYAFCFWVTNPSMPFLLKEHGATSLSFGYFASLFNFVQLIGGLTVGNLQDRYSGSAAMNITQLGSLTVYLLMFFATSLNMLYLSRIPTILQQSMQVAQAFISKNTDEESRSLALSRISISYGVGMVVGGFVSGHITSQFGTHAPFVLAAALTGVMVFVNAVMLESEGLKKKKDKTKRALTSDDDKKKEEQDSTPGSYVTIVKQVYPVLIFLMFLFATRSMYESVYNLTLIEQFGVQQEQMGSLLSFFAAISSVSNILILPFALKVLKGEDNVTKTALFGSALAYIGSSVASRLHVAPAPGSDEIDVYKYIYLGCLGLLSVFSTALYTTSTSYISKKTDKSLHGQSVALSHALRSAVGIVCPIISTALYAGFGGEAVAVLNSVLLVAALLMYKSDRKQKKE